MRSEMSQSTPAISSIGSVEECFGLCVCVSTYRNVTAWQHIIDIAVEGIFSIRVACVMPTVTVCVC